MVEPHQKWPQWKADCKEFICKEGKLREKADVWKLHKNCTEDQRPQVW